jgi:hypothetical protein
MERENIMRGEQLCWEKKNNSKQPVLVNLICGFSLKKNKKTKTIYLTKKKRRDLQGGARF